MARLRELIRQRHDPGFDFVTAGAIPWTRPADPVRETRVALVSTGGLHTRADPAFETEREREGDTSFRWVPHGARPRELALARPYVDERYAARDPEVALPMRALERLYREGRVGRPAPRHAVFCGGILRPLPGLERSVERLVPEFERERVGAAVLLPTCSLCVQTVCLLARLLEAAGIATVTVSMLPELSRRIGAPRTLAVRFPFGAPCGDPGNRDLHRAVLAEALDLFARCEEAGQIHPSAHAWRKAPGGG